MLISWLIHQLCKMITLGETRCGMYGNTPYYFCKFSVNLSLFLQKSLFKKFRSKVLQSNVTYWFGGLIGKSTIQFNFYILLRYNMQTVRYTNHVCTTHWMFTYRCTLLISTIRMFPGPFAVNSIPPPVSCCIYHRLGFACSWTSCT